IGTYSAVGLAPVHISSLFLAESLVYAVLGAVTGYLLGQIVVKFLMYMGLLRGLVLNYSSLSAVFATIIIFITVLLSTLYPARKAAQMAVPDVTRRWILPDPKGDTWEFEFPFTLNEVEVLGMVTFLAEYYNAYQDISIGNFYTSGAELKYEKIAGGKNRYILDTKVWLAPFDLAVSQTVRMSLEPMGEYDFYLINLLMKRTSGEETDWKRLNRRFLDSMRKQFLVWRTINEGVKRDYDKKGRKLLNIE
ncbi:MAG TPA: ABC transporter permease, partial [bacterium]|nr:ABC transporter permease [bacterium]